MRTTARGADILSDSSKYDPHTKETADHSLPYVLAAAVAERQVTPLQFTMAKIMDPTIRAQLKKVVVVADHEIEKVFPALQRVIVKITTTDGRTFEKQLDYPKGDPRNPLTDREIEEKFEALAEPVMTKAAQTEIEGRDLGSRELQVSNGPDEVDESRQEVKIVMDAGRPRPALARTEVFYGPNDRRKNHASLHDRRAVALTSRG